jgi:hypothetical protein
MIETITFLSEGEQNTVFFDFFKVGEYVKRSERKRHLWLRVMEEIPNIPTKDAFSYFVELYQFGLTDEEQGYVLWKLGFINATGHARDYGCSYTVRILDILGPKIRFDLLY